MRIGLVVDATCDLPPEFLAAHGIRVMPIGIRLGEQRLIDRRDPDTTLSFYRDHLPRSAAGRQPAALRRRVAAMVPRRTGDRLRLRGLPHRRQPAQSDLRARHPGLLRPAPALPRAPPRGRHRRSLHPARTRQPLGVRRHRLPGGRGHAPAGAGQPPNALRTRLEQLSQQTCTYLVADDLGPRRRGFQKGDRSGFVDRVRARRWGWARCSTSSRCSAWPMARTNRWRSRRASRNRRRSCSAMPWRGYRRVSCWHRNWVSAMPAIRPRCATCRASPRWRTPAASATSTCTWACSSPTGGINLGAGAMSLGFIAAPKAFA